MRRRRRAGAERQAGVEPHDHRVGAGVFRLEIPRRDPEPRAEAHRPVLVEPGPFPVLVGHFAERRVLQLEVVVERFQCRQDRARAGLGGEQRGHRHLVPERLLADARLEDGLLVRRLGVRIHHRHRQRTDVLQRVLEARVVGFAAGEGEFEEGHGAKGLGASGWDDGRSARKPGCAHAARVSAPATDP
jgi:hypothetical protein